MVEWCKVVFENMTNWKQVIDIADTKIGQENNAFHIE
jgi:hypothetical protein